MKISEHPRLPWAMPMARDGVPFQGVRAGMRLRTCAVYCEVCSSTPRRGTRFGTQGSALGERAGPWEEEIHTAMSGTWSQP